MPRDPEHPFGHNTLKLRAVFVPEAAKNEVSPGNISRVLSYDPVKIPAVFVPDGGDRPGHPYEYFGKAVFKRAEDGSDGRTVTVHRPSWQSPGAASQSPGASWQSPGYSPQSLDSSSQSPDATQQDSAPEAMLPRTRYRFGAALSGGRATPPNPTLNGGKSDPIRQGVRFTPANTAAGIAAWRSMANPGKTWRDSLATAASTQGERGGVSTAAAGDADPAAPGGVMHDPGEPVGTAAPPGGTAGTRSDADHRTSEDARVQAFLRPIRSAENQDEGNLESD